METGFSEKRRAPRFPIPAPATVRNGNGQQVAGSVVNVSSSGILVDLAELLDIAHGDEVMVHIDCPAEPDFPLPAWGMAKVVRMDGARLALELFMAGFHPLPEEPIIPEQG
jgi:hypothetical protein